MKNIYNLHWYRVRGDKKKQTKFLQKSISKIRYDCGCATKNTCFVTSPRAGTIIRREEEIRRRKKKNSMNFSSDTPPKNSRCRAGSSDKVVGKNNKEPKITSLRRPTIIISSDKPVRASVCVCFGCCNRRQK